MTTTPTFVEQLNDARSAYAEASAAFRAAADVCASRRTTLATLERQFLDAVAVEGSVRQCLQAVGQCQVHHSSESLERRLATYWRQRLGEQTVGGVEITEAKTGIVFTPELRLPVSADLADPLAAVLDEVDDAVPLNETVTVGCAFGDLQFGWMRLNRAERTATITTIGYWDGEVELLSGTWEQALTYQHQPGSDGT